MENERRKRVSGMVDFASFGVLLVVLGFIWSQNADLPGRAVDFFRSMGRYRDLPPYASFPDVYDAFVVFVYMLAAWNFLLAAIKVPLGLGVSSALGSALGGAFLLALGYFTKEYCSGALSAAGAMGLLLIMLGVFVILGGVTGGAFKRRAR
ncbi:MAG: hypothetical protein JTT11_00995 [Candidatus Brockarchaeota archaeon]|nr:hypothetical protein [Candidatus Brockarchaeota archaeon]